jgi:hypothetical protein
MVKLLSKKSLKTKNFSIGFRARSERAWLFSFTIILVYKINNFIFVMKMEFYEKMLYSSFVFTPDR